MDTEGGDNTQTRTGTHSHTHTHTHTNTHKHTQTHTETHNTPTHFECCIEITNSFHDFLQKKIHEVLQLSTTILGEGGMTIISGKIRKKGMW